MMYMYKKKGSGEFIVNPFVLLKTTTGKLNVKFISTVFSDYVWDLISVRFFGWEEYINATPI